ncbi:MAG: hypothetical protein KKA79_04380, partial [Nanoarchaeota archaeon]|nr:hypothetical protein [Nanoarchaeota archaeon]
EKFLKKLRIGYLIIGFIIISTMFYIPYFTSEKSPVQSVQNDHDLLEKSLEFIPEGCVVVTQESYLFDFFDQSAISIYIPLYKDLNKGCFYYYEGELCWRVDAKDICSEYRRRLNLSEPLLSNGRHSLYKIESAFY